MISPGRLLLFTLVFSVALAGPAQEGGEARLMRFPDIHEDQVVFSSGGDLWIVSSGGGAARRLTSHPGLELFPKFSPDGKWIAFTGQYDGNFNVYVMPAAGGEPRQLTFLPDVEPVAERMGPNNMVIEWLPDGKRILFLSRRDTFNTWFGRLFTVPLEGGLPERLPVDKGGLTSFNADGTRIAYNRIFRNFRTWKRYQGGMAQDIGIYDFKAMTYERLTDHPGTDTYPMWHGDVIYFGSDRGAEQRMNLYAYSLKTRQTRRLTEFQDYDVNWPSLGRDAIVFENGGWLYVLDLKSEKVRKLSVRLPGDRPLAQPRWSSVEKNITDFDLSPEGNRAVFTARGDVFTVPAKEGATRNLTRSPGAREQYAVWSPDGKWIAYLSDRTGEDELYLAPHDGMGAEVRVTTDGAMFRLAPVWSPDSRKLLFADKDVRLWFVDVNEKKPVLIDRGRYNDITDYSWSPDSRWVAYAKADANLNNVIYLYSLQHRSLTPVTTSFNESWNPVFDPEGRYLYFLSNRDYNQVIGVFDFEFANPKATRVYAVTLRADLESPFAPRSDEAGKKEEEKKDEKKEEKPEPPKELRVDLEAIRDRVVAFPIPVANISNLRAAKDYVFYVTKPVEGLSGPLPGETAAVRVFELKERKESALVELADRFALSFDGSKLLYSAPREGAAEPGDSEEGAKARTYGIVDAKPVPQPHKPGAGALNLGGLRMEIRPREEWGQIFHEVWRQQRDYFFQKAMAGVDWARERERYQPLVEHVANRYDLTYVLGEMLGELSTSHTYVGGGDFPELKPVNVGVLGVDFELDRASGRYRFKKIYPGENWNPALRSPLTEPGVDVKEGEYLLAVNGRDLRAPENPYRLFVNTANENVTLTVNSKPTEEGARRVMVKPLASEFKLRELDWISTNRRKVEAATEGRAGYVYIPDMGPDGLNEFVKQYFPQVRKEALIVDVRYNGGGFVDALIFARLRRVLAGMDAVRNWEPLPYPTNAFHGHLVCVTNEYAASDGDIFTYYFKHYKLGPVIGMRTWGGVRGIRGYIPLIDGGYVTRPEFAFYDLDSRWLIENRGVAPDIEVDNPPDQVMRGRDPQLEKAIEVVMQKLRKEPRKLPPPPPDLPAYPDKPGL